MKKALLLVIGFAVYLAITHIGYATAMAGTLGLKKLYTQAEAQAAAISVSNR
jgi:hypothetical protein